MCRIKVKDKHFIKLQKKGKNEETINSLEKTLEITIKRQM